MPGLLKHTKSHYKNNGRHHLPWRKTKNPYRILVSEMMLQQTQVDRVVPFYNAFVKIFPTPRSLAEAPLSAVLQTWQGLGYNRRAKYLHEAAKNITGEYGGKMPREVRELETLPGVGHYTARAIAAFAYNKPEVFIETNIRTVFLCYSSFLQKTRIGDARITDAELLPFVEKALKHSNMPPREFYAALMDHGTYLKKSGVRLNTKSAHYVRQSKFEGSLRQVRGVLLTTLTGGAQSERYLIAFTQKAIRADVPKMHQALIGLLRDGLIKKQKGLWMIAQ